MTELELEGDLSCAENFSDTDSDTSHSEAANADQETAVVQSGRRSRPNTAEEKRRMRKARRRRVRKRSKRSIKRLKKRLEAEVCKVEEGKRKVFALRRMSRCFWERWQWELAKRKEALLMCRRMAPIHTPNQPRSRVQEIDPAMLSDPSFNGEHQECYIGRGSFGIVKLQIYRGVFVAVKELLPQSLKEDVQSEGEILSSLCHPFLPYMFGICTTSRPYKIIMQYHGFVDESTTTPPLAHTFTHEIHKKEFSLKCTDWLNVCAQVLDAVNYLHSTAGILHNDIKNDNIVFGLPNIITATKYQILLIDFGKATTIKNGKLYSLTEHEKVEYRLRYPHLAPEVVEGEARQTIYSDIYSVGGVLYSIIESGSLKRTPAEKCLLKVANMCRLVQYHRRWSAQKALSFLQKHNF